MNDLFDYQDMDAKRKLTIDVSQLDHDIDCCYMKASVFTQKCHPFGILRLIIE